jgi:hypothetical protein
MSGPKIACLVVAGMGVLALLGVCSFGTFVWNVFSEPREAGHAFFTEIRSGRYDAAYKKSATAFRDGISLSQWDAMRSDPLIVAIHDSEDATFSNVDIHNDRACLQGWLTPSGAAVAVSLVREDDTWKVAGVTPKDCKP